MFLHFDKIDFGSDFFPSDDDPLEVKFNKEQFQLSGPNLEGQLIRFESKGKKPSILELNFQPNGNNRVGNGYRIWLFSTLDLPPPSQGLST